MQRDDNHSVKRHSIEFSQERWNIQIQYRSGHLSQLPKNYNMSFSIIGLPGSHWHNEEVGKQDKHLIKGRNWCVRPHSSSITLRQMSREKLWSKKVKIKKVLWWESGRTYMPKSKPLFLKNHPTISGHWNLHISLGLKHIFPRLYSKKQPATFTRIIILYHWPLPSLFLLQLSHFTSTQIQTEVHWPRENITLESNRMENVVQEKLARSYASSRVISAFYAALG